MMTTNRLSSISARQKRTRLRDALFAAFLALAAVVSVTSVSTAAHAAAVSPR
jgi:hypothetical protein